MKEIGIIVSYNSYEEYTQHKEKMEKKGYKCLDYIPEGLHYSYYTYIRYVLNNQ